MTKLLTKRSLQLSDFKDSFTFLITLAVAALLWEGLSRSGIYPPHLFPPPTLVLRALGEMAASGELWTDIRASGLRWILGLILGNFLGISLGVMTGTIPLLKNSAGQLLNLLRTIPFIVLLPLAILWFGLGEMEKILFVAWGAVFPVWLNTQAGVMRVEREYIWAARCLGAKGARLYWEIHMHRCLPFIMSGIRISIATALFGLGAAEMSGAFEGVAYRIFYSREMFQTEKMMAGIVVVTFLGFALDRGFVRIAGRLIPWWREEADER
ncbi:MAG: ABC transporter permease [bacterium]